MILQYEKILDNCGFRTQADLMMINRYIYRLDWKNIILPRHQKFIEDYIEHELDIVKMARDSQFTVSELLAIFLRIESQFELYTQNNGYSFNDLIVSRDDIAVYVGEHKQTRKRNIVKKEKPVKVEIHTGLNEEKNEKIKTAIEELIKLGDMENIIGPVLSVYVSDLCEGLSIKQIAEKHNKSYGYLCTAMVGAKKPRSKTEKGLQKLVEEYKQKESK